MARVPAARRGGLAVAVLAGALATGVAGMRAPAAASAASTAATARPSSRHIGIVISGLGAFCVPWHPGITGDAVLNAVARVNYRSDGVIVQIDGAPASGTADGTHFWSYWHDAGTRWEYSRVGAGSFDPAAGDVEGWRFDDGATKPPPPSRNPHGLFAAVCGSPQATARGSSGVAAASSRAAAASRGSSPAPTVLAAGLVAILAAGGGWALRRRRAR